MEEKINIERAVKGDEEAFVELIEEYRGDLYKCAYYYLRSREDALDAVSEMSYRAYKGRKGLKKNSKNLKGWFTRILINCCHDMRRMSNVVSLELVDNIRNIDQLVIETPFMDNYDLFVAVEELKDPYKEVIILRFLQDMKIKDIADILGKPESTVKSRIKKGVELLKCNLKEVSNVG